jgi:hypothetical protein
MNCAAEMLWQFLIFWVHSLTSKSSTIWWAKGQSMSCMMLFSLYKRNRMRITVESRAEADAVALFSAKKLSILEGSAQNSLSSISTTFVAVISIFCGNATWIISLAF